MDIDLFDVERNTSETVDAVKDLHTILASIDSRLESIERLAEGIGPAVPETVPWTEYLWQLMEINRKLTNIVTDVPPRLSIIIYVGAWSLVFKVIAHFLG